MHGWLLAWTSGEAQAGNLDPHAIARGEWDEAAQMFMAKHGVACRGA
jgi:hypothetical protein